MDKKYYWIVAVAAGVLIFGCILYFSLRSIWGNNNAEAPAHVSLATPTLATLATPVSTPTPLAVPGDVWTVIQVGPDANYAHGYKYVIAVFANQNVPSLTIRRQCGAPGWPAPKIGQLYLMNSGGVLVPIEGIDSPLQRFYEFEGQ